jgi:hypothetical protein
VSATHRSLYVLCDRSSDPVSAKDKMTRYPAVLTGGSGGMPLLVTATESANATLLATFCKDQVPRSCDHTLLTNKTRSPRPCSMAESFLSSGDSLTLQLRLAESTALRYVQCSQHRTEHSTRYIQYFDTFCVVFNESNVSFILRVGLCAMFCLSVLCYFV